MSTPHTLASRLVALSDLLSEARNDDYYLEHCSVSDQARIKWLEDQIVITRAEIAQDPEYVLQNHLDLIERAEHAAEELDTCECAHEASIMRELVGVLLGRTPPASKAA